MGPASGWVGPHPLLPMPPKYMVGKWSAHIQPECFLVWANFLGKVYENKDKNAYSGRMCTVYYSGRQRGVSTQGVFARGWGVFAQLHGGGVSAQLRGVCQTPPMNRMTDACENLTFPQLLLRTIKLGRGGVRNFKVDVCIPL